MQFTALGRLYGFFQRRFGPGASENDCNTDYRRSKRIGDATLATTFTQQLTARFVSDNSLRLTDKNSADSELDGVIIQVSDAPSILQGVETVSARRVTIQVHVTFQDLKLRKKIWDKTFSDWGDYASGSTLTQRDVGIQTALQKLEDDILNETVAGW